MSLPSKHHLFSVLSGHTRVDISKFSLRNTTYTSSYSRGAGDYGELYAPQTLDVAVIKLMAMTTYNGYTKGVWQALLRLVQGVLISIINV